MRYSKGRRQRKNETWERTKMLRHEEARVCLRLERECDEKNHHPNGGDRGSGKRHPSSDSLQDDPDGDNLNEL